MEHIVHTYKLWWLCRSLHHCSNPAQDEEGAYIQKGQLPHLVCFLKSSPRRHPEKYVIPNMELQRFPVLVSIFFACFEQPEGFGGSMQSSQ